MHTASGIAEPPPAQRSRLDTSASPIGTFNAAADVSAHIGNDEAVRKQAAILQSQSARYKALTDTLAKKLGSTPKKAVLIDTTLVGGETLAHYIGIGTVPPNIQQAYEMAYPGLAADHSFLAEIHRLDSTQLQGFVAGIKGKLFEIQYTDYLNDGNLPAGFHAEMAPSATNPGWDIAILGPDNAMRDAIQLKATDSASYVHDALDRHPNIDVVTTTEVHSHLMLMGTAEHVTDSHIANHALDAAVNGGIDQALGTMHWTPSVISLAIIAFSAYNSDGLTNYEKSKTFGERSAKSYLAYLAGGSIAVMTGTVWIGILGGIGSRFVLGSGRKKRERLDQMKTLIQTNELVINRMENHA